MRIVRVWQLAALLGAAAVVAAAGATPAMASATGNTTPERSAFKLPYTDPNQAGWLTLCGTNLKPVTHGSITSVPFVWRVVSDVPTPKGYWIKGVRAVLYAYQPRLQTPAGAWSGTIMATPSLYSNRKYPMAQFTPIDQPLSYMTRQFPPIDDHLIELRLYIGAPDRVEDVMGYAAADIQVIGNTWTLVAGGHASCTAGNATSMEVVAGMPGARGTPKPQPAGAAREGTSAPSSGGSTTGTAGSGGSGAGGSGSGGSGSGGSRSVDAADTAHTSSLVPVAAGLAGFAVLVVALLAFAVISRRRRRTTG